MCPSLPDYFHAMDGGDKFMADMIRCNVSTTTMVCLFWKIFLEKKCFLKLNFLIVFLARWREFVFLAWSNGKPAWLSTSHPLQHYSPHRWSQSTPPQKRMWTFSPVLCSVNWPEAASPCRYKWFILYFIFSFNSHSIRNTFFLFRFFIKFFTTSSISKLVLTPFIEFTMSGSTFHRLIDRSFRWLIDWLICRLIDWSIDWSIYWSVDWLIDRLIGRYIDLSIDWLIDFLFISKSAIYSQCNTDFAIFFTLDFCSEFAAVHGAD